MKLLSSRPVSKPRQLVRVSVTTGDALLAERGLTQIVGVTALAEVQIWIVIGSNDLGVVDIFKVAWCSLLLLPCFSASLVLFVLLFALRFRFWLLTLGIIEMANTQVAISSLLDGAYALLV